MKKLPDIPQREFEIMEILWDKGEATIRQVHDVLIERRKVAYTTVATLLMRLRGKGAVKTREQNFAYVFRPAVEREPVVNRKVADFITRVLGGDVAPLATYIAENRKLTPEQIKALEEIVRSASGKEGD